MRDSLEVRLALTFSRFIGCNEGPFRPRLILSHSLLRALSGAKIAYLWPIVWGLSASAAFQHRLIGLQTYAMQSMEVCHHLQTGSFRMKLSLSPTRIFLQSPEETLILLCWVWHMQMQTQTHTHDTIDTSFMKLNHVYSLLRITNLLFTLFKRMGKMPCL